MPKIRTNKTASKKFRATASGKIKRGKAYRSHNTAKMTPKRKRTLRKGGYADESCVGQIRGMLPYL